MKLLIASLLAFFALNTAWAIDIGPSNQPNYRPTYSASANAITPPATPTDICTLKGSASATVLVTRIEISSTQTTAGVNTFFLVKRSTVDTSGTPATMTAIPHNSKQGAATAVAQSWTANPTLGTAVGTIRAIHMLSPAPASTSAVPGQVWDFDGPGANVYQPITLNNGEQLAVNFNGAALPSGLSVNCNFQWVE